MPVNLHLLIPGRTTSSGIIIIKRIGQRDIFIPEQPKLFEPGVYVEFPVQGTESVVGDDEHLRVLVDVLEEPPDGCVYLAVEFDEPLG